MAEATANGFGKAEAPPKPAMAGPYTATSLEQEKRQLQNKLWELQKSGIDAKAKWWSFCKIHAEGNTDPKNHDAAFLTTFFESFEAGDIGIEEGCPFTAAKGGKDSGKGWGKDGGKAGGKDGGKGWGKDSGKSWGKDSGKGWGKDSGKGCGKDSGKGWGKDSGSKGGKGDKGGKSGGGGKPNDCKIFVGGIPNTATEEELRAHFAYYGTVAECNMKYDDWGGFRGFAFLVFSNAAEAQKVLADAANQNFKGKWIDCKSPAANTGGGDKGGSKGGDKGGKFDKGGKGGGKFDKGGKGGGKFDKGGKGGKDKGGGWGGGKW